MFISQHGTQIPGKEPLRLLFPLESREGFTAFYRWTRLMLHFNSDSWYGKSMKKLSLKHIIWKEGAYYVAQCLNVDVSSFGQTKKEALANLKEALELHFAGRGKKKVAEVKRPEVISDLLRYA